ncbi:MAG: helicase HerA domain-containing protein [Candidatus Hadarchaeales archaeon]
MEIGTVIATGDGPNPRSFSFVVHENGGGMPVRVGQFVEVETEEGKVVALVTNLVKTNRYFMRAEAVREYERGGRALREIFPVDRWEYLVAEASTLGVISGDGMERATFPPSPGQRVMMVDREELESFLGLRRGGIELGYLKHHQFPVNVDLTKLFQKHVAILAISGAGKSNLASVVIEELLKRRPEEGRPAVVVVDPHGEYRYLAEEMPAQVEVLDGRKVKIGTRGLNAYSFREFLPEMSEVQVRELQKILERLQAGGRAFGLEEIIAEVESGEKMHNHLRQALEGWLFDLASLGIFDVEDFPEWGKVVKAGRAMVIDLSGIHSLRKKQMIVAHAAKKLFFLRRRGAVPPFVLCLEEAHQFAPAGEARAAAISKPILETIAREGRKFYASLMLISQRPVRLSTTLLSQVNTNIIMRITNPYDLEHIKQSSEAVTGEVAEMISSLEVGEALGVGEVVKHPVFVKVRRKNGGEGGKTLEEEAAEFERRERAAQGDGISGVAVRKSEFSQSF